MLKCWNFTSIFLSVNERQAFADHTTSEERDAFIVAVQQIDNCVAEDIVDLVLVRVYNLVLNQGVYKRAKINE